MAADGGRIGYQTGTNPYVMGNFMPGTGPGFLTGFGLNLLSTPPTGNIFQTAATAAKAAKSDASTISTTDQATSLDQVTNG